MEHLLKPIYYYEWALSWEVGFFLTIAAASFESKSDLEGVYKNDTILSLVVWYSTKIR